MTQSAARYDPEHGQRWLAAADKSSSPDSPRTIAEHLGIDDGWPGSADDIARANIKEFADTAVSVGVIEPPAGVIDIELITTVDDHLIAIGLRIVATATTGREAVGPPLTNDDLTDGATGTAGALNVLRNIATRITEVAQQLAPLPIQTPDGHLFTPWTDGYAIGLLVTSPTGRQEVVYLNPSSETTDAVATATLYQGEPDQCIDQHVAVCHVDLLTTRCDECGRPIPDTATAQVNAHHATSCSLHPLAVSEPRQRKGSGA